jgi:hypothetical protein
MGWDKALAENGQPSRTGSLEFIAAVTSAVASASRKRAAPVFLPHTRRNSSAWRPGTLEVVASVNYEGLRCFWICAAFGSFFVLNQRFARRSGYF